MSFRKATDLLRLAEMAGARYGGVSLDEIVETFGVDRRTAQRMTRALEDTFGGVETRSDPDRRKHWRLDTGRARLIFAQGLRESELTALEMSIRRAEREGAAADAAALARLRDRLLAAMPGPHARRVEADAEALLEAQGYASRPGPRVRVDPGLLGAIAEALKAPQRLSIEYAGARDTTPRTRLVEPYGLLLGTRRYLVAREPEGDERIRHFRLDRIAAARLEPEVFARDPDFDLAGHAACAFGSFHDPAEIGEVVWRFAPQAAPIARAFVFHPHQQMTEAPDGALIVRFRAGGHLEMAWHLYQWGDAVEVLEPEPLRRMVEGHQRADFPALP
ncbi:helix-turn-helix transcriptional regulator [Rhodosalinus sp.]|uniref:helix-turn-helix transcriptional regulator n=1 Tax=Rhodosalinus sp. TaxID=2047741 RepID=UPI003977F701